MTKREYYRAACRLAQTDRPWCERLLAAVEEGEVYLRPLHVALVKLALRRTVA